MSNNDQRQWWLCHQQITYGPFTYDYIAQALERGEFDLEVQACQVGTDQWKTLRAFSLWSAPASSPAFVVTGERTNMTGARKTRRSQQLPPIPYWITIYALYAMPPLSLLGNCCGIAATPTYLSHSPFAAIETLLFLINLPISLACVALGITGGIQLRRFRKLGRTLLLAAFGGNLAWGLMSLVFGICLSMAAASDPQFDHFVPANDAELNDPAIALLALLGFLGVVALLLGMVAFEAFAFGWLLLKGKGLPLK